MNTTEIAPEFNPPFHGFLFAYHPQVEKDKIPKNINEKLFDLWGQTNTNQRKDGFMKKNIIG